MTELYHHGIKGQKWGTRRYQHTDGSLTDEGRKDMVSVKELKINGILLIQKLKRLLKLELVLQLLL